MVYRVFLPGFPHFVFALVACHFSLKKKNESPRKWNVFFCFFWRVYVCAGKEKRQRDLSIESRSIDGFFGTFVTPGLSRLIEDRRRWAGSSCFSIGQIRNEKTTNPPPTKKKRMEKQAEMEIKRKTTKRNKKSRSGITIDPRHFSSFCPSHSSLVSFLSFGGRFTEFFFFY